MKVLWAALLAPLLLSGCLAMAAGGAVVGAAGAVVETGVKATGAVVGAVLPGGDDDDDEDKDHDRRRHH